MTPAIPVKQFLWLMATASLLLTTSPTFLAQTKDSTISAGVRLMGFLCGEAHLSRPGVFGAVDNFTDSRDPNVNTSLPIFRPELARAFPVGMRFIWAQERR
jgi:hypothetical protein